MTPLIIKDQFGITLNLHMSPIPPTSFLVETFFPVSYSKSALNLMIIKHQVPVVQSWVIEELIIILSKRFVELIALKLSNNNFGIEYTFIKSSITFLDRNEHPPKLGKQILYSLQYNLCFFYFFKQLLFILHFKMKETIHFNIFY